MEDPVITIIGPNVDPDALAKYFLDNGPLPKGAKIINKDELCKFNSYDNEYVECIHNSNRPSRPPSRINVILNKLFHVGRNHQD